MIYDKMLSVRWQAKTKTWVIDGDIGFRRHRTKKDAVAEARDYCRDLALDGYVTKLIVRNKVGGVTHQVYP
jgi:hypothetical protein